MGDWHTLLVKALLAPLILGLEIFMLVASVALTAVVGASVASLVGWDDYAQVFGLLCGYWTMAHGPHLLGRYQRAVGPGFVRFLGYQLLLCIAAGLTVGFLRFAVYLMQFWLWPYPIIVLIPLLLGALAFVEVFLVLCPDPEAPADEHLQGARLLSLAEARRACAKLFRKSGGARFWWGELSFPLDVATRHLLGLATTGGGKSTFFYRFLKSILRNLRPGWRVLLFDPKGAALRDLEAMGVPFARIISLDPRNTSPVSRAWNIAADAGDHDLMRQIAEVIARAGESAREAASSGGGDNRYFLKGMADVVFCVIAILSHFAPGRWRLRHLVCILLDFNSLLHVINHAPQEIAGLGAARYYFYSEEGEEKRSGADVFTTIRTSVSALSSIAARWDALADRNGSVSIREWATGAEGTVLVLAHDFRGESVLQPMNEIIIELAGQAVLSQRDATAEERFTLFALDELPLLKIPSLPLFLADFRSKGAAIAACCQSRSQLVARYGEPLAEAVGSLFGTWFIGQCKPESAKWASEQLIGEAETGRWRPSFSDSSGDQNGPSFQVSYQWEKVRELLILPSTIASLPICSRTNGLTGYVGSGSIGGSCRTFTPGYVLAREVWSKAARATGKWFTPWEDPAASQLLRPLGPEDWALLGLPAPPDKPKKQESEGTDDEPKNGEK